MNYCIRRTQQCPGLETRGRFVNLYNIHVCLSKNKKCNVQPLLEGFFGGRIFKFLGGNFQVLGGNFPPLSGLYATLAIMINSCFECSPTFYCFNKKLSYCWETVRRDSMPRIAEMDVKMTT